MSTMLRTLVTKSCKRAAPRVVPRAGAIRVAGDQRRASSSQPAYEGHVPLNWFEHAFMFMGASYMSFMHPARGGASRSRAIVFMHWMLTLSRNTDMVAAVADLTSGPVLPGLRDKMLASPEGRRILKERPRIKTDTVDMDKLALLPEGTFGNAYVTWLERCGVTPDTREPVRSATYS